MIPSSVNTCQYSNTEWVVLLRSRADFSTQKEKSAVDSAIACLWEQLFTFCVNRAARYGQDEQVAQDAATCAYLRIRRAIDKSPGDKGSFRGEGQFLHWCYRIAAHCLNDLLRKIFGRGEHEVALPDEVDDG